MNPDDINGYAKLWEEVLMTAWSSARRCKGAFNDKIPADKSSLKWIEDMGGNFKLACHINGYEPESIRDGMIKAIQSNRKFRLNRVGRKRKAKEVETVLQQSRKLSKKGNIGAIDE